MAGISAQTELWTAWGNSFYCPHQEQTPWTIRRTPGTHNHGSLMTCSPCLKPAEGYTVGEALWPTVGSRLHVSEMHQVYSLQSSAPPFLRKVESLDGTESLKKRLLHMLQSIFPNYLQLEASKAVASNCAQNHGGGSRALSWASERYRLCHLSKQLH